MRPYFWGNCMLNQLRQETKPGYWLIILEVPLRRHDYGILKGFGKILFSIDKLTSCVNDGRRMSLHLLSRNVSQGSKEHVFARESLINLRTLLSEIK